jgi:MFS family permease
VAIEDAGRGISKVPGTIEDVFESVVWPAVAGNVLWSFLTVLFTQTTGWVWFVRAVSLAIIGVYLFGSWRRTRKRPPASGRKYFLVDGVYAALISVFAISTAMIDQGDAPDHIKSLAIASIALTGMFVTAAVGHWQGYWAPYEGVNAGEEEEIRERKLRSRFSAAAVVGLLISYYCFARRDDFSLSSVSENGKLHLVISHLVAISAVVMALVIRRNYLKPENAPKPQSVGDAPAAVEAAAPAPVQE